MLSRRYFVMKLHLLFVDFPSMFVPFPSPRESASIFCNWLWFIRETIARRNINKWVLASWFFWFFLPLTTLKKLCPLLQMQHDCCCTAFWSFEAIIGRVVRLVYVVYNDLSPMFKAGTSLTHFLATKGLRNKLWAELCYGHVLANSYLNRHGATLASI